MSNCSAIRKISNWTIRNLHSKSFRFNCISCNCAQNNLNQCDAHMATPAVEDNELDKGEVPKNAVPRLCCVTCKHLVLSPRLCDSLEGKHPTVNLTCRVKGRNQGAIADKKKRTGVVETVPEKDLDLQWVLPYVHNLKGPGETLRIYLETTKRRPLCCVFVSLASVMQHTYEDVVALQVISDKDTGTVAWLTVHVCILM